MKAFSPAQIKGDLVFLLSVVAVFGFKLTETQTVALLGASGLICIALNFAEAHVHVGAKLTATIDKALAEIKSILPQVQALVDALPGKVATEVAAAIEKIEKGPAAGTVINTHAAGKKGV